MEELIPLRWSEEQKIENIVKTIGDKTGKKVSYTYYWYYPVTDKNKIWKITVEGHLNVFEISNILLMGCGIGGVNKVAAHCVEEVNHWSNVTDKTIIDIKAT